MIAQRRLPTTAQLQIESLPDLPALIRYVDAYNDSYSTIRSPNENDEWILQVNGDTKKINIADFAVEFRPLMRNYFAWSLSRYAPNSVFQQYKDILWAINELGHEFLLLSFTKDPGSIKQYWLDKVLPTLITVGRRSVNLKRYLFFLSDCALGSLSPGYIDYISTLPGPKEDLYASIRSDETFLTPSEEAGIIDFIDNLSSAAKLLSLHPHKLRDGCILVSSYQHAMRPIQIAKVVCGDVLVRLQGEETVDGPIVHVRFHREKQSSSEERLPLLRKIKREWAILFAQYAQARQDNARLLIEKGAVRESFFGLTPARVSQTILTLTDDILQFPRSATELRHTAAQRMADAGASHEELQELLGHNNKRTALRYFVASATQAERVNKALVISPIYAEIAEIHRTRSIDMDRLLKLPPDQQIGAVAHGVPIAGIGGCELGQSLCSKNPVLSCYVCRKFLPVRDLKVHEDVRDTLRPVVKRFFDASRGEPETPAYTQLRTTISAVQQVIKDFSGED